VLSSFVGGSSPRTPFVVSLSNHLSAEVPFDKLGTLDTSTIRHASGTVHTNRSQPVWTDQSA